jgi:hypothetical protein
MPTETTRQVAAGDTIRVATTERAEAWTDWGGPEPAALLTRDEIVTQLQALGVDADGDTVRYWESVGALPRSIKRWHEGATRAVYPDWAVPLVLSLRELQDAGLALAEIGPVLREIHELAVTDQEPDQPFTEALTDKVLDELSGRVLYEPARRFHQAYERLTGNTVDHLRVDLTVLGPERTLVASYSAETVESLRRHH